MQAEACNAGTHPAHSSQKQTAERTDATGKNRLKWLK